MKFWWVNQNQSYKNEIDGGYLWSPKYKKHGATNRFYENMKLVSPNDIIFSFSNKYISVVGVATSYCYEAPKPKSLQKNNWSSIGWKVDVKYIDVPVPIRPIDNMRILGPLLPSKYSPLQPNGNGNQAVYLAELPVRFAKSLIRLIRLNPLPTLPIKTLDAHDKAEEIEDELEDGICNDKKLTETQKKMLCNARIGQGTFRKNVFKIESYCRVTKIDKPIFLIASHIKPWKYSTNRERLDGHNGFLMSPNIDKLFDKGFISFTHNGKLMVSKLLPAKIRQKMGISLNVNVGTFTKRQIVYLEYHRKSVYKG